MRGKLELDLPLLALPLYVSSPKYWSHSGNTYCSILFKNDPCDKALRSIPLLLQFCSKMMITYCEKQLIHFEVVDNTSFIALLNTSFH